MEEQTMVVTQPGEVQMSEPAAAAPTEISLDPKDFQKELQKIAAEKGLAIDKDGNANPIGQVPQEQTRTEAAPQPTPQAGAPTNVPEKFQLKDGGVDLDKVQKSTINAEQALKKYQDMEVELRRKQNEVALLKQGVTLPQASQTPAQNLQVPTITAEQINAALTQTNNPGKVFLDLLAVRDQAVYQQAAAQARQEALAEVEPLRNRVEATQRQSELQKIADRDPWVFSEEGVRELSQRRVDKPWLNQAPEPYLAAYKDYIADREMQKSNSQVQIPNPTAATVRAPATPVNAGNRTNTITPSLAELSNNPRELNKFLDSLPNEAARKAFFETTFRQLGISQRVR